jgi:hypothetical protein
MWWFEGGCNLTLENMVIDGQQVGNIQGSAVQLIGVQGARLTDLTIYNPSGDFVTLSGLHEAPGGGGTYPSTDVLVSGNHFTNAGRQGITTEYVDRVHITRNTIDTVAATVFDMESDVDGGSTYNVRITDNTVGGGYAYLLAALSGATTSWISFDHNWIDQMKVAVDTHGSNWTIANNVAAKWAGWPDPAITVNYSVDPTKSLSPISNFLVSHNVVPTAPFGKYQVTGREFADSASSASPLTLRSNYLPAHDIGNGLTQVVALSGWGTSCGDTQDAIGTLALNNALQPEPACNTAYSAPTMPAPPLVPGMFGSTTSGPPAQTPEVPMTVVLPFAAGSIIGVAILLNRRRNRRTAPPFG